MPRPATRKVSKSRNKPKSTEQGFTDLGITSTNGLKDAKTDTNQFILSYADEHKAKTRADLDFDELSKAYLGQLFRKLKYKQKLLPWQEKVLMMQGKNPGLLVRTMRGMFYMQAKGLALQRAVERKALIEAVGESGEKMLELNGSDEGEEGGMIAGREDNDFWIPGGRSTGRNVDTYKALTPELEDSRNLPATPTSSHVHSIPTPASMHSSRRISPPRMLKALQAHNKLGRREESSNSEDPDQTDDEDEDEIIRAGRRPGRPSLTKVVDQVDDSNLEAKSDLGAESEPEAEVDVQEGFVIPGTPPAQAPEHRGSLACFTPLKSESRSNVLPSSATGTSPFNAVTDPAPAQRREQEHDQDQAPPMPPPTSLPPSFSLLTPGPGTRSTSFPPPPPSSIIPTIPSTTAYATRIRPQWPPHPTPSRPQPHAQNLTAPKIPQLDWSHYEKNRFAPSQRPQQPSLPSPPPHHRSQPPTPQLDTLQSPQTLRSLQNKAAQLDRLRDALETEMAFAEEEEAARTRGVGGREVAGSAVVSVARVRFVMRMVLRGGG